MKIEQAEFDELVALVGACMRQGKKARRVMVLLETIEMRAEEVDR